MHQSLCFTSQVVRTGFLLAFFSHTSERVMLWIELGGGVALLYASRELEKIQTANFDQKIGVQIIQNALKVSFEIVIEEMI